MLFHRLLASITFVRSHMLIVILVYFCDRFFFFLLISKFCFAFYLSFPNLTMIVCLDTDLLVFFLVGIYWSSWICRFDFSSNLCNFWQVFLQIHLSVLFCLFPSGILLTCMLVHLMLIWSLRLRLFSSLFFLLVLLILNNFCRFLSSLILLPSQINWIFHFRCRIFAL